MLMHKRNLELMG